MTNPQTFNVPPVERSQEEIAKEVKWLQYKHGVLNPQIRVGMAAEELRKEVEKEGVTVKKIIVHCEGQFIKFEFSYAPYLSKSIPETLLEWLKSLQK